MKIQHLALLIAGPAALGACATTEDDPPIPAAPVGVGALAGTVAADRDGDGFADGYYGSDGVYRPFQAPPCPEPAPMQPPPSTSGERG